MAHRKGLLLLAAMPIVVFAIGTGCPFLPGSAAVLEGDWQTTDSEADFVFVRFDNLGVVTGIIAADEETGQAVIVSVNNATTTLEDSNVTLTIPTLAGNAIFTGTLSEDQNTMTGTLATTIEIGDDLVIIIPQGDLTLTRVDEIDFCPDDPDKTLPGVCGCGVPDVDEDGNGIIDCEETGPADTFPTSLHATRNGKAWFYSEDNGGFEQITGIPMTDLECQNCHASTLADGTPVDGETYEPSCADCHADLDNPSGDIEDSVCLGCHSRQQNEINLSTDVHLDAGLACVDCHNAAEMHGDGTEYNSQLDEGAMTTACEDCHEADTSIAAHALHNATVDCSACHVQTVVACYSCHFESEVAGAGKRFFTPPLTGFKMLMQFRGEVQTATFQALTYEDDAFYVIAPYYAHTVTADVNCDDCHSSAAIDEYNASGTITVASWTPGAEGEAGTLTGPSGVIPIPPDWETALQWDFVTYTGDPTTPIPDTDPTLWELLEDDEVTTQMLYGEPLTADQMSALGAD
jgi:hypothetical protein